MNTSASKSPPPIQGSPLDELLLEAIQQCHKEHHWSDVKELLDQGAGVNYYDQHGHGALHYALNASGGKL